MGPDPTNRGKLGSKRHVHTDGRGIPLGVTLSAANNHDKTQLKAVLNATVVKRPSPKKVQQHLCLDKGYDCRSTTLTSPTDVTAELWEAAKILFDKWPFQPVRLIGVSAERLTNMQEASELFPDPAHERQRRLDGVTDQINAKFGEAGIKRVGGN